MQKQRPTGVVLIAILFFLAGVGTIVSSFCALFTPIPGSASIVPILIGLVCLAIGASEIAIGWGLLELRDWARLAAIVISALALLAGLIAGAIFLFGIDISGLDTYFGTRISFPGMGIGFWLGAVIYGLVIWYLLTPQVQEAFGAGAVAYYPPPIESYPSSLPPTVAQPPRSVPPSTGYAAAPLEKTKVVGQPAPVQGWLVVRSGSRAGKSLGLSGGARNTIGRDGTRCDLVLDDPSVSGEHARVQFEHGQFVLYDLASRNGTFVNNKRVQRQPLLDDDVVRVGDTTMVFKSVR